MARYEYRVVSFRAGGFGQLDSGSNPMTKELTKLGAEGWRVVAIESIIKGDIKAQYVQMEHGRGFGGITAMSMNQPFSVGSIQTETLVVILERVIDGDR